MDQRAEFEVGIFGQKAIDQRAVLGPQRALDVKDADAGLDHQRGRRTPVVLDDPLSLDRLDPEGVFVAALCRGAKIEGDRLRAFHVVESQFLLGDLPAVFFQADLDDAADQPDGVDRCGNAGQVAQQHPVGTVDAGNLDVAVGRIAPQTGPYADGMDCHAQLAGGLRRISG